MKKIVSLVTAFFIAGITVFAQHQYEVIAERPNEKTFKGILSRDAIESDTSFKWYALNRKGYTAPGSTVAALKQYADSIQLMVFMGTWCEDSHVIIPRLFSLLDNAGFDKNRVTLIGTDRNKKTLSHLSEALNVNNVPTIIIMKAGKEMGRVIEYGKTGEWDKELGTIIHSSFVK